MMDAATELAEPANWPIASATLPPCPHDGGDPLACVACLRRWARALAAEPWTVDPSAKRPKSRRATARACEGRPKLDPADPEMLAIRAELAALGRRSRSRVPAELRDRAITWTRRQIRRGIRPGTLAVALGVSAHTTTGWGNA